MGLKKSVYKLINKVVAGAMGTDLSQPQTEPSGEPYITEGLSALARAGRRGGRRPAQKRRAFCRSPAARA